jgi:SAM-dependent methyltransferase
VAPRTDSGFLAPPGEVADWRLVVLVDAAAGAGVLDALPGTPEGLAAPLGLDVHGVRVVLDALVAWGVVERRGDGAYAVGPQAPGPDRLAGLRHHARAIRAWSGQIDDRLRGGADAPAARQAPPDPELFIDALGAQARGTAPALVERCLARFPSAETVLDLGGGHGEYSLEFARRGLRATLQDLPTMIDIVARRGRLAQAGVELYPGSFFESVPEGPFDLAFCTGITQTFDGDHNLDLYRRLRPVVSPGGGVAVTTFLRHRNPLADVFAVQMLVNANGGDTHNEDEYRAWLGAAGFRVDDEAVDLPDRPQSILFAT